MLRSFNLNSRIIAATMAAAALTGLTQAYLGAENVRSSLSTSLERQLSSVAAITANGIENFFADAEGIVRALGVSSMINDALGGFSDATLAIGWGSSAGTIDTALEDWYVREFGPDSTRAGGGIDTPQSLMPSSYSARYLQYRYIGADPTDPEVAAEQMRAEANAYAVVHERYHTPLSALREALDFEDVFLIDTGGRVVYSVLKEIDYMSDLVKGPFHDSGLGRAFDAARRQRMARPVVARDFSAYLPSNGKPSFFIVTPVFDDDRFLGAVAVQLVAERIDEIVTNRGDWAAAGLGEAGDVFAVGEDGLLRTTVRGFEEDPDAFLETLRGRGVPTTTVGRIETFDTPVNLLQTAFSVSEDDAGGGGEGGAGEDGAVRTVEGIDGSDALAVVVPVKAAGLDWRVVAQIPASEARAPVNDFLRLMMIALAVTVAITTIGATWFANRLVAPLRRLAGGLDDAAEGNLDAPLAQSRNDAIGVASRSAQTLVDSVRERLEGADRARRSTQGLLERFLPDGIVRTVRARSRDGDEDLDHIAETIENATFVTARLSGYDAAFESFSPEAGVRTLDELVELIDLAAEQHGVEKVRTAGDVYFAIAGLSAPLIDHRQRALAFAVEFRKVVGRFRRDRGIDVGVMIGIASGRAVSGIVGHRKLVFDVWGAPVTESVRLEIAAVRGEIRVATELADQLSPDERFETTADGTGVALVRDGTTGEGDAPASAA